MTILNSHPQSHLTRAASSSMWPSDVSSVSKSNSFFVAFICKLTAPLSFTKGKLSSLDNDQNPNKTQRDKMPSPSKALSNVGSSLYESHVRSRLLPHKPVWCTITNTPLCNVYTCYNKTRTIQQLLWQWQDSVCTLRDNMRATPLQLLHCGHRTATLD